MIWHSSEKQAVLNYFGTDKNQGLTKEAAEQLNSLKLLEKEKPINEISKIFFSGFSKPVNVGIAVLTVICAVLSIIADNVFWPYIIALIILIFGNFSYALQKHFAKDTKSQVKNKRKSTARVIRDGETINVPSDELVVGDIIILQSGDYIPADARLIETVGFRCDEYALTGEIVDVEKDCDALVEDIAEIPTRSNMVFAGCSVTHGSAKAIVTEIDADTEIKRQYLLNRKSNNSNIPFNNTIKSVEKFSTYISVAVAFLICFVLVLANLSKTELNFALFLSDNILNSIAVVVAAVPETLPISAALIIWTAIKNLSKKGIVFHKSSVLEKAAGISVICADKTGVLTNDKMLVEKIYDGNEIKDTSDNPGAAAVLAARLAIVCGNGVDYGINSSRIVADSSENALIDFCSRFEIADREELLNMYPPLAHIPFDNTRKRITSVNMISGKTVVIVKGAPEGIIPLCRDIDNDAVLTAHNEMSEQGLRVIAVAYRPIAEIPAMPTAEELEQSLIFAGLIGLSDAPDSDIITTIEQCSAAGIRTVMTTGDSDTTARVLARRIGILPDGMKCIDSSAIKEMSDSDLDKEITGYAVFSRIDEEDRYRIVKSFMHNNETVAVTGSRSCDAAVLRKADIGFALEDTATDVAKIAADFIVTNRSISSLLDVIKFARNLFEEIKKIIYYFLSSNIGELLALFVGTVLFSSPILIAPQILLINLITDILPCISLGLSPVDDSILNCTPSNKRGVFNVKAAVTMLVQAFTICVLTVIAFAIGSKNGTATAQTMAFASLALLQIVHIFPSYSEKLLIDSNILKHRHIFTASALCIVFILIIVLSPLANIFGMTALTIGQWLLIALFAVIMFVVDEGIKIFFKLYNRNK